MQKSLSGAVSSWMVYSISECNCLSLLPCHIERTLQSICSSDLPPHSIYQQVNLQFLMEIVSVSIWSQQETGPHNVTFCFRRI